MKLISYFPPLTLAARLGLFLLLLAASTPSRAANPEPPRIKRSDAFFGIHFDFHANEEDNEIGKNTTRAMIEYIIDQVHPDFLQIDCKGHKGFSSYPTKVGNVPPAGIVGDPLKLWRQVTAERGVSLIMHYSGVIDAKAVQDHPDWCVIDPTGEPAGRSTSLFGPYADKLLIPQLKELALDYGVDGVWVDGDCWGVNPDYSPAALDAFKKATGISKAPLNAKEPHWFEFMEIQREAFRKYLLHYVTEVKKVAPNFQIASNWAYSERMPEAVSVPVDFLSGDVVPIESASARVSARYLAGQGKPWDLMAWGFTGAKEDRVLKTAVQLEHEAAMSLAAGGGFQVYLKQKHDGSVPAEEIASMPELAKFCRARQPFCHRAKAVPQVAMLLSTPAYYRSIPEPFARKTETYLDPMRALLGGRYSVELLSEHRLTGRMKEYPLIAIPDWDYVEPAFKKELLAYVQDGGQLLLIGRNPAKQFASELDIQLEELPATEPAPAADGKPAKRSLYDEQPPVKITLGPKAEAIDIPIKSGTPVVFTTPAASLAHLGKGRIAAVYSAKPIGLLLAGVARRLFPEPMVDINGRGGPEISINRINGKLAVNLVNPKAEPLGPAEYTIRQQPQPAKVTLQPANEALPFKYEDGKILVTVPKVEIYDILLVE